MAAASGATGDIKNNLMKLLREVQRMKLRVEPDIQGLSLGAPSSLLPIIHHSLMHYSLPLASWLSKHDYELYGKNDLRFVEGVYKVLREVFHYYPRLTKEQFLTVGYVERKLLLVTDLLRACQSKHHSLTDTQTGSRGRGRTAGKRYVSAQTSKSEVLTVQNMSGISSAWTEPLVAQVQGPEKEDEEELIPLLSLDHSPPPHLIPPSQTLELTPSPPHFPPPPPTQSSPLSHKSQPVVVRHNPPTEPVEPEGVPGGEKFKLGGPLERSRKVLSENMYGESEEKLVMENLSSPSSSDCGESGGTKDEEKLEPPGGPLGQGVDLVEVNARVQQLAVMMEKMSARFVLLETQLKTVQRRGTVDKKESTPQIEHTAGEGDGTVNIEKEQGKPYEEEVVMTADVSMVTETTASTARAALRNITNPTTHGNSNTQSSPNPGSKSGFTTSTPHIVTTSTPHIATMSTPHTRHHVTAVRRSRERVLSAQLARLRSEERLAAPSHPHKGTPSHPHKGIPSQPHKGTPSQLHEGTPSHPHKGTPSQPHKDTPSQPHKGTPSHPHKDTPSHPINIVHTPQVSIFSPSTSPSSPDDTARLIANLRDRAQRTKEFLQKANSRP